MIVGVVLAAGAGSRFGGRKQVASLAGRPLLEHALEAMSASPVERVIVVLGAACGDVLAGVRMHRAEPVLAHDWEEGMSASLRTGIEAAGGADAVVVALGDQPLISPSAIEAVITARGGTALAVRANYDGRPGHPVLLERPLLARASELRGDVGARMLLEGVEVRDVPCDGLGSPTDVDTRRTLERLSRAANAREG